MTNKYFDPELELRPIKFLANYYASKTGEIWQWKDNDWHLIKQYKIKTGYMSVQLYNLECVLQRYSVHRLVALAWLGKPPNERAHCCHKNDVKNDNRVENLYWGTAQTNSDDYRNNKHKEEYHNDQLRINIIIPIEKENSIKQKKQHQLIREKEKLEKSIAKLKTKEENSIHYINWYIHWSKNIKTDNTLTDKEKQEKEASYSRSIKGESNELAIIQNKIQEQEKELSNMLDQINTETDYALFLSTSQQSTK